MKSPDRVSYSFNVKIGLPKFSSVGFDVGMESDVREGETTEKAFRRVKRFVEDLAGKETDEIRANYKIDEDEE